MIQDVSQRIVVDSEDDDDVRGNAGGSIRTHRYASNTLTIFK